jgi:hypothetical protein
VTKLEPVPHSGSRQQAQDLVSGLPADLTGHPVALDCSALTIGSPSFLDELVKQVLVVRNAEVLDVVAAPDRTRTLLQRAAENRHVAERLRVSLRAA